MTAPVPPEPDQPPVEISPEEADRAAQKWREWLPPEARGLIDAKEESSDEPT